MLFNSSNDIKDDILNKISEYLLECIQNSTPIDKNNILSLIRTYFNELKIRNLLGDYKIDILENTILMSFKYNNDTFNLNVDLFNHVRKMKISKIYKKIIQNFLI